MNTWSRPVSKPGVPPWLLGNCFRWLRTRAPEASTPVTDVSSCFAAASSLTSAPRLLSRQANKSAATYRRSFTANRCGAATQLQSTTYRLPLTSKLQTIAHPPHSSHLAGAILNLHCASNRTIAIRRSCDSLHPIRRPSLAHLPPRANEPAIPQRNHTDLQVAGHHDGMVVLISFVRSGRADQ